MPLSRLAKISAPKTAPKTVPRPPIKLVPPITHEAIASSSIKLPASGDALQTRRIGIAANRVKVTAKGSVRCQKRTGQGHRQQKDHRNRNTPGLIHEEDESHDDGRRYQDARGDRAGAENL